MIHSAATDGLVAATATNDPVSVWHSDSRKDGALRAYAECGTVAGAARAAGVSRQTFYTWMESDSEFAAALVDCRATLADELEDEAIRRAKKGSDSLLMFLLRAHRPERYREKHVIEVVSPEVQTRLAQQADALQGVVEAELDRDTARLVLSKLANRLREVWS